MGREVVIVPHTHWDREWYDAYQTFRMRLVDLLDQLLPLLEADPAYAHFMLDGQMAVVDDYLAIRPEEEGRLRRLAVSGRLGMGPWYILMDEFLVSGETMIRDLQLGLERAGAFGGATEVGYLPDMFGHVAQMPQLLRQFGFEHAVVWRGVPSAVTATGFWWEAPDGSTVRAEYLPDGYSNGANLPDDAKDLVTMLEAFEQQWGDLLVGPLLWMNGTDHQLPRPWLGRVVAEVNALQDDYRLRVGSLADYLALAPTEGLATWRGELRSGARTNLLMGVGSNRVDVKQRAAAAERALERLAEPLSALHLPPGRWPAAFLAEAWREVVRNSAHDSSCACSIDEVCNAVNVRYEEARQIGDGLVERAAKAAADALAEAGPVVLNSAARARSGVVELTLPGHEPLPGTQLLRRRGGTQGSEGLRRGDLAALAPMAVQNLPDLVDVTVEVDADGVLDIRLVTDPSWTGPRYQGDAAERVVELADADPDAPARIALVTPETHKALAYVHDVPGFGWQRWTAGDLPVPAVVVTGEDDDGPSITNDLVTVAVDPTDGTFAVDGLAGFGRLVDDGDTGDTYNYNPPEQDVVVDTPDTVAVRVLERGPVRARVAIDRTYTWPRQAVRGARVGEQWIETTTTVEVLAGSPLVRVTTEIDNQARDHRVRTWLPLPEPARSSRAECAFAVVERGLEAEGGPTERGLPTFPSRRFVLAGGLTVVHDGLLEYELVDLDGEGADRAARQLALTLLRCTGVISQGPMGYRPAPAGPVKATPGAQLPGRHVLRWAVRRGDSVPDAYAAADDAFLPLPVARAAGGGAEPDRGSRLAVDGAEVSAVLRQAGQLTVRVFNPSDEATTVTIDGRRGWLTDLRGRPLEPFEGSFALGPWRIATAVLDDPDGHRAVERTSAHQAVVDTLTD